MTELEVFGLGCLGGILPDLLRLIKGRHDGAPGYLKDWFYWVMSAVLVLIGGLAAYYGQATGAKEAIAFGFAAPEIISRAFGGSDADRGAPRGGGANIVRKIRSWWAF